MRGAAIGPVLADSGLGEPVLAVIRSVCAKARLSRAEKRDVARELVEHFHAGIERGETAEALIAEFGDPHAAGKLIARAVRRKRGPVRRAFMHAKRGVYALAGLLLVIYLGLFARFMLGSPSPSRDYVSELAQRAEAIPESDRAWPLYLEAARRTTDAPPSLLDYEHDQDATREYAAAHPGVLELIRSASERPHIGYPVRTSPDPELARINALRTGTVIERAADGADPDDDAAYNDTLIGVLLENIGEMRLHARLLEADADLAMGQGDTARFVSDTEAMIGIAEQFGRARTIIEQLVGWAIASDASRIVRRAIEASPGAFDDAQLRRLQRAMETRDAARKPVDLSLERLLFEDMVQRIYTDNGSGNGHLTRSGVRTFTELMDFGGGQGLLDDPTLRFLAGPASLVVTADRAELTAKYDEIMLSLDAYMRLPYWEEPAVHPDVELERMHTQQRFRYPLITTLMPALANLRTQQAITRQRMDGAVLAVALERHRMREGSYPTRLVARELEVPADALIDQMTGHTLVYSVSNDGLGYTLYSLGMDLDDDGGVPMLGGEDAVRARIPPSYLEAMSQHERAKIDGDWVLFPLPTENDPVPE